jgi:hypothetical protein
MFISSLLCSYPFPLCHIQKQFSVQPLLMIRLRKLSGTTNPDIALHHTHRSTNNQCHAWNSISCVCIRNPYATLLSPHLIIFCYLCEAVLQFHVKFYIHHRPIHSFNLMYIKLARNTFQLTLSSSGSIT